MSGSETGGPVPTQLDRPDAVAGDSSPDSHPVVPTPPRPEGQGPHASTDDGVPAAATTPPAVFTPLRIPVAVVGRSGAGYLVRTPCGNTAEVSSGVPIEGAQVVLDPGHGGKWNTGAIGPNGLVESDLNLRLSRAVLHELAERGISAATTRTGDYGMLLSARAGFADALGADALISIHHNAPTWSISNFPGTEVYVQSATTRRARADSSRLGGLLYEEITAALSNFDNVAWTSVRSAGVLRVLRPGGDDAYGMIRRPSVPSVVVEYGYLSNPSEARLFATDEYIRVAAVATSDAIEAYLHSDRPGSGFVERPRVLDMHSHTGSRCNDPALE